MISTNQRRILKIGLALLLAGAAGFYLENGMHLGRLFGLAAMDDSAVLIPLRTPRPLPDIGFTDDKGRPVRLSEFRGKVVVLNFWATWCPPCRKEMPSLDRLQAILGDSGFEVIALSVDRELPIVRTFYAQTVIARLGIYQDNSGQTMQELAVSALPTTLLIDRQGREIARKIGPAEWDSPALVDEIRQHVQ